MENTSNNNKAVYISYASKSKRLYALAEHNVELNGADYDRDSFVDNLLVELDKGRIVYKIDKNDVQGGSITEFEQEIGNAKYVVVVLSDKYFISPHCMYEWDLIHKDTTGKKIYYVYFTGETILSSDGTKFKGDDIPIKEDYANYYSKVIRPALEKKYKYICEQHEDEWFDLSDVEAYFCNGDINAVDYIKSPKSKAELFKNSFPKIPAILKNASIIKDAKNKNEAATVAKYIQNQFGESIAATSAHNAVNSLPRLPEFRTRDHIIERKKEIEKLEEYLAKKRLVNMIGLGGCGKSMLSECFYLKYKDNFNFVTSVIINTDYYKDFVVRFCGLLSEEDVNQKQGIDSSITYEAIIDKLEKFPMNGSKYNLIVIDINETAPYAPIRTELDKFQTRLKTWRILVVSREAMCPISNVYTLENVTEVAKNDLKEIFMLNIPIDKDEEKHNYYKNVFDEEKLNQLFSYLLNLPILVVQLARYLMRVPKRSYNEIIRDLKIDEDLFNKKFSGRPIPEKEQYKMIGDYLSALVLFKELDLFETGTLLRDIVRHIALWPQKIYTLDFIEKFIAVSDSNYTVAEGLSFLVDKCIVTTRGKDADMTYQIHGEIAKACREQIYTNDDNKQFRNFREYFRRVDEFDEQYVFDNQQHEDYREIIEDSLRFIIPDDDFSEDFILRKAHEYGSKVIYEHILKIKYLKLKNPDISVVDLYKQLNQDDIANTPVDVLYYSWLDKESGFSSNLDDYKNENHLSEIDQLISDMVYVKGGSFKMGAQDKKKSKDNYDEEAFDREAPVHIVRLDDFYLAKTQVTQGLWKAVMGRNPSCFKMGDDYPVERVSWYDCLAFIMRLNEMTKMKFRLPTEAQWEFAARGGNKSQGFKYSGSNSNSIYIFAWFDNNSHYQTHAVKQKLPNELGIYDMSGNVEEWCQDWFDEYPSGAVSNPQGASSGSNRVLRGGSWCDGASLCRVSNRDWAVPDSWLNDRGFRLALLP